MKRNLSITFVLVLVLVLALASISAALAQNGEAETLYRVEVRNRTDQPVSVTLVGEDVPAAYVLSIPAGSTQVFSLRSGEYDHTTLSCGRSATGTLEVTHTLRLTFTPCYKNAPNSGAPAIEKVHLTDAPKGLAWYYQYNPTPQPSPTSTPGGGGPLSCQFTAGEEVTIYRRPSTGSGVFSVQPAGFTYAMSARTADGWIGFDPGVAQAANIGEFRLRWIPPGVGSLSAGCGSLPVVWGPPPGICFDMPMQNVPVRANPDLSSPAVALLHVGEFAAILGLTPDDQWAKVDLGPGNTGSSAVGWVEASTLNVNGPCDSLPTVSP